MVHVYSFQGKKVFQYKLETTEPVRRRVFFIYYFSNNTSYIRNSYFEYSAHDFKIVIPYIRKSVSYIRKSI